MLALVGGEQLEAFGVVVGLYQLQHHELIVKQVKNYCYFEDDKNYVVNLVASVQNTPICHELVDILRWLKSVRRLMSQPMSVARAADWDMVLAFATLIEPPQLISPKQHRNLQLLGESATRIRGLFDRHGALFVPAALSTMPLYGIRGQLQLQHLGTFTPQNAIDYWMIPGMRNVVFTVNNVNTVLRLPVANIISPIPAELHQLRMNIPLVDLEAAFAIAGSVTPRRSAVSVMIDPETFRFVTRHPSLNQCELIWLLLFFTLRIYSSVFYVDFSLFRNKFSNKFLFCKA